MCNSNEPARYWGTSSQRALANMLALFLCLSFLFTPGLALCTTIDRTQCLRMFGYLCFIYFSTHLCKEKSPLLSNYSCFLSVSSFHLKKFKLQHNDFRRCNFKVFPIFYVPVITADSQINKMHSIRIFS